MNRAERLVKYMNALNISINDLTKLFKGHRATVTRWLRGSIPKNNKDREMFFALVDTILPELVQRGVFFETQYDSLKGNGRLEDSGKKLLIIKDAIIGVAMDRGLRNIAALFM